MPKRRKARAEAAILLVGLIMLVMGCAGAQTSSQPSASPLYLLTSAGFQQWTINDETPKREALYNNIPPGKIVTYVMDGTVYHVYADKDSHTLFVGDGAAYQKYLALSHGSQLCERVEGQNQEQFWRCFVEFKAVGAKSGTK